MSPVSGSGNAGSGPAHAPRSGAPRTDAARAGPSAAEAIAGALGKGSFDPQHAGDLFLRADAEKAIRSGLGPDAQIAVAGRDDPRVRPVTFMGARFAPDLVVEAAGGQRVAVTITLLRGDVALVAGILATALVLSASGRFQGVVAFVLDRRLAKPDPFGDDQPAPVRALGEMERHLLDQLWQRHQVRLEIKRQDPFGWG